jgi:iron complex outermembrane receptor protein
MRRALLAAGIAACALATVPTARAQDSAESPAPAGERQDHPEDSGQAIVVVGRMISGSTDPIQAPVVLQGDSLTRDLKPQLGDMLAKLPGVSTSAFAPGASRPVLRGFDGPRVQVLLDGLGSLDASSVSADHAVSLDTLTIDRIDVLHGPRALLYASDPSGGVVNALDKRIPRRVPDAPAKLDALASYGTSANAVQLGAAGDFRLAPRLVAHIDASYGHSGDQRIGGYVLSPGLRDLTFAQSDALRRAGDADGADSLLAQANRRGSIANSGTENWTLGAGLAFIDDGGSIGLSVERLGTDYGIPPRPEAGGPGSSSISLRQTRIDMRAALNLDGFFDRAEFRGAYGDYSHVELDHGQPATRFANQAIETRLELVQNRHGGLSGTSGIQYGTSKLTVTGDEKLLPDSRTDHFAAFTLQRVAFGPVDLEGAARFEHTSVHAQPNGPARSFAQWSGVAGFAWHVAHGLTFSVDVLHGERAPSSEELFIDGIHDATQSYERGNPAFAVERSNGLEAGLRYSSDRLQLALTAYGTNFSNFITAVPTGSSIDGFPVFQYIQAPARFRGVEAEGSVTLADWGERTIKFDTGLDYTHAELVGIGPVPRIPPLRLRGGIEYGSPRLTLRGEMEWNARQGRVAANEFPVAAFTLLNLSATWQPLGVDSQLTLILSGDNLFNVSGRHAASETRDFVPIAGRDIRLTAKVSL